MAPGEIVALLGANGAGKTTLMRTISGLLRAHAGDIRLHGKSIARTAADAIVRAGVSQAPEGRRVFPTLSVAENLLLGGYTRPGAEARETQEQVYAMFPRLRERAAQLAGTLSGGEQQMLAIGRGLVSSPRLLMLDEPSMGLSPAIADFIFTRLTEIHRETGLTLLLVEQRVVRALRLADHGYVLEAGRIVLEGSHEILLGDDRVRQAYLGM